MADKQNNQEISQERLASIIEDNMGLVIRLVEIFKPKSPEEYDEFIQLGRIGLWKAVLKYDPARSKFSTTAWHYIRFEILRHIQKRSEQQVAQLEDLIPVEDTHTNVLNHIWEYVPDSLSEKEQAVLNLRLSGYTFVNIGNQMGFSRGWANNTYNSAVEKIRHANNK